MPSIGHLFYGLCLLIPIYYYTRDKFNYKVAFIFLVNNYCGPDAAQVWYGLPFHSLLGFLIFAIPLSLYFSYFSRFSLKKNLSFVDDGIREVNWKNAYCLCVAGGICHFFIDQFYHYGVRLYIWPGISLPHEFILSWGGPEYHEFGPLTIISFVIITFALILSLYTFKKGYKETFKLFLIIAGLTLLLIFSISVVTFGGERDVGVLFHSVLFVLLPLFLLFYVARDIEENPNTVPDVSKIERKKLLKIIALISILFSGLFFAFCVYVAINPDILAVPLSDNTAGDLESARVSLRIVAIIVGSLSGFLIVCSIGLLKKIKFCRISVIAIYTGFFILAFPYAIVLFLHENEVKELFNIKTDQ